jgi:hypothetical protein
MFGIDDVIAQVANLGTTVITRIWPDATEVEKAKLLQVTTAIQNEFLLTLAQVEVNKVEASSTSTFVSGWRPFVGWVCGLSLAYAAIIEPIARFIAKVCFGFLEAFPVIDTTITLQILFGMLGFGAARTFEKVKGVGVNKK